MSLSKGECEMSVKLEVGKFYERNDGKVFECTEIHGDDPLRVGDDGYGPFVIDNMLYHQDGRFGEHDLNFFLSIKREVTKEGKPVEKYQFKVGDRVKVTTPYVVLTRFKGQEGVITMLHNPEDGQQVVEVKFSCGTSQTAFVDTDGLVLVTPQEEDEWSDWIEDRDAWSNHKGPEIVETDEYGYYARHKVKKEPVKKLIEVGKFYTVMDSIVYECIHIEGEYAFMKCCHEGGPSPALVWRTDGSAISLPSSYDVNWSKSPF
jgi:hypothetical protein